MTFVQWHTYNSYSRIHTEILERKGAIQLIMTYPSSYFYIPSTPLYHVWEGDNCKSFDNLKEAVDYYARAIRKDNPGM